jgi:C-terminal processing protease CtpA/Prc
MTLETNGLVLVVIPVDNGKPNTRKPNPSPLMKKQPNQLSITVRALTAALFLCLLATSAAAQEISSSNAELNRERGREMLSKIKEIIKDNYYDPKFHGLNLDEHFKAASARIKELETAPQIFTVIAQVLLDFNDSHTRFLPPPRINEVEYGFSMQMIGDKCHVVDVKHGSDAETKGLKVGDIIADISGYTPRRDSLWALVYLLYALDPRPELTLNVTGIDGRPRQFLIQARMVTPAERKQESNRRKELEKQRPELKIKPYKCHEVNADLIACKLYTFLVETDVIDRMMKEVGEHKKMILDLRGNGGGAVQTEVYLTGYFFDHDVKIGDEIARKKTIERIAKSRKAKAYNGKLVVLIDSRSQSASEVFARVVQIEKRGQLVGDASAGAVMTSMVYPIVTVHGGLGGTTNFYGELSLTVGDLVMSDGLRLEGTGVLPDFRSLPTGPALAERSDPALVFALSLCGTHLSKEEAGRFHFITRVPETGDEDKEDQ